MSLFSITNASKGSLSPSRNPHGETMDRRRSPSPSPRMKRAGFFSSSEDQRSKAHHQPEPKSFQEQAVMYGMNLKSKRDQDAQERQAIEKKMAKQSGKKLKSTGGRSKTDDAKTAFKLANFFRKHK